MYTYETVAFLMPNGTLASVLLPAIRPLGREWVREYRELCRMNREYEAGLS
jgi:hypothetical protein